MNGREPISLLYPADLPAADRQAGATLDEHCFRDLDIAKILDQVSPNRRGAENLDAILLRLCVNPRIIRYRQDILDDLLTMSELVTGFDALVPVLAELSYARYREDKRKPVFHEVVWRLNELARLVECTTGLHALLSQYRAQLRSEGLQHLLAYVSDARDDPVFRNLEQELPDLQRQTEQVQSLTIGVNLNQHLLPVEAALLSINNAPVSETSLLKKLFGKGADSIQGIAPLHSAPQDTGTGVAVSPLLTPLFRDVADVLDKTCRPLAHALKRYTGLQSRALAAIGKELQFYTRAAAFITKMQKTGLPMCKPNIVAPEERVFEVDDNYNINLALHQMADHPEQSLPGKVIANTVTMNGEGRIFLLTGPNKGGKTTYMQAVGLTHVLAQAGLYVPGTRARISPVDALHTHFPEEEQFDAGTGRFGDEARRMQAIFTEITRHSLVLLNESFSSTSPAEALELSCDITRLLRQLGARAIFATHLHELAADADALNNSVAGDSRIVSMVASRIPDETAAQEAALQRSYHVRPGPPMQSSRARELARQYGVSFEQLHDLLHQRGVIPTA